MQTAIYLIRQYTSEKLVSIGHEFNISKYSTVSSVVLKVVNKLQKDKKMKKRINEIEKLLSKGQRQICLCPNGYVKRQGIGSCLFNYIKF